MPITNFKVKLKTESNKFFSKKLFILIPPKQTTHSLFLDFQEALNFVSNPTNCTLMEDEEDEEEEKTEDETEDEKEDEDELGEDEENDEDNSTEEEEPEQDRGEKKRKEGKKPIFDHFNISPPPPHKRRMLHELFLIPIFYNALVHSQVV